MTKPKSLKLHFFWYRNIIDFNLLLLLKKKNTKTFIGIFWYFQDFKLKKLRTFESRFSNVLMKAKYFK